MKRKLLTAFLGLSLSCYAQSPYVEGFEGEVFPPEGWTVYENGSGVLHHWKQTIIDANAIYPPYEGDYAAFIERENVPDTGPIPIDWLVTPLVTVPEANPVLHFYSRQSLAGDQGGNYRIMMASEGAELSDLNSFTVVQSWTEPELNPVFSEYKEVYVPIPSTFAGQNIYLAFVMEGDEADRWLVDNVSFASYCIPPDNLSVSAITLESATFTWSANNASQWEIEVLPLGAAPTGEGVIVDENVYTATELDMGEYRFYVRAICSEALQSSWSGPFYFDILNGFDGVVSYDSDGDEVCDSFIENTEVIITIGSEQYSVYTNNQGYYSFYGILDAVATVSVQINAPNGFSDVPVYEDTFDFTSDEDFAVDFV